MFKHRLTRFCVSSLFAICVLFVGGSLQSCKDWLDVYPYDDPGDPEWLGASVYDFLKKGTENHTYNNYVAIIDSLGEQTTLSHTGSKTLFVADDEAFNRFFAQNDWGVKSVAEMSKAQMKTILFGSMLDNAMLLDMFSSSGVTTADEGTCLRRFSSLQVIDSIPLIDNAGSSNQNKYEHHANWPTTNKFWDAVRGKDRTKKIRLAMDGNKLMLVHFIGDYLKKNNIETNDIEFLFRKQGEATKTFVDGDALIYGNKILSSDVTNELNLDDKLTITCKNGYVYRMDELLLPPSNMADELRKREDTRIVSHLLDRFCIPVYDSELSSKYNAYHKTEKEDSVFTLRYFTKTFTTHNTVEAAGAEPLNYELLAFDPGNNTFGLNIKGQLADDMAAMFVPNDVAMYEHFTSLDGRGRFLLTHFAPDVEVPSVENMDIDALLEALDRIPEENIAVYLNNWMKSSFAKTVLSRFDKITDDANELMEITEDHVDECVIANNGVIYITNHVFAPTTYESVVGPTKINDNMRIIHSIVNMLHYDYYLLAMDANYTFIVPDDGYFLYYDPLTKASQSPKAYLCKYGTTKDKDGKDKVKLTAKVYEFDRETYELSTKKQPTTQDYDDAKAQNRFKDLMEYLIIVHDDARGVRPEKKYYQTKGYGTIKIDATDSENIKIYGGEQLERGTSIVVAGSENQYIQENGIVYSTVPGETNETGTPVSAIPTPPTRSVFDNLELQAKSEFDRFYEFFKLCYPNATYTDEGGLLDKLFGEADDDGDALKKAALRYSIFNSIFTKKEFTKRAVPFFNIYHYTVYVPTNESIQKMYELGLPKWDMVIAAANDSKKKNKAASMLASIINFAKYHFQDNSIYVDGGIDGDSKSPKRYATAVMNETTNRFYELEVERNEMAVTVYDEFAQESKEGINVQTNGLENKAWNIMCRDNVYESDKDEATINLATDPDRYSSSSFSVIQPIDGVLRNKAMFGYDGRFKRFADNGLTVDIMYVDGTGAINVLGDEVTTNADVTLKADNGGLNYYLVADAGTVTVVDFDGNESMHKAGYLMQVINEGESEYSPVTRERLRYVGSKPVLVTDEGYWIKEEKNGKYSYGTLTDEEGNVYIPKYDNNAKEVGKKPVGNNASVEGENNN